MIRRFAVPVAAAMLAAAPASASAAVPADQVALGALYARALATLRTAASASVAPAPASDTPTPIADAPAGGGASVDRAVVARAFAGLEATSTAARRGGFAALASRIAASTSPGELYAERDELKTLYYAYRDELPLAARKAQFTGGMLETLRENAVTAERASLQRILLGGYCRSGFTEELAARERRESAALCALAPADFAGVAAAAETLLESFGAGAGGTP